MNITWIVYGLGAALSFSGMSLAYRAILRLDVSPIALNLFVFIFTGIGFAVWILKAKLPIVLTPKALSLLILASACALIGNYLDVIAVRSAPNPGYATSLKSGQIIIITLLYSLFFDSSICLSKIGGIVLVIIGIFLISL